jgi:hypothetical protein
MLGQGCLRLLVGSARTWLQQRYYSERCRNRPPPRGGVSRESSRISWKTPRSDGLKALPPEGRGTPPEHRAATSRFMREASVHTGRTRNSAPVAPGRLGNEHHHRDRRAHLDEKVRRLPPQAWGTLRQRGGSEPLARTTRSAGFQPGHTMGAVPDPVPNPDYHHQVLGGVKAGAVARGLPAGLPAGWDGR